MGTVGSVSASVLGLAALIPTYWVWENYAIFDFQRSLPVVVLAYVLVDFSFYWQHRLSHRIRWGWAAHVVHHSSQYYNFSTALRQSWTGQFTPVFLLALPLYIIGIEPILAFFVLRINAFYQFWVHTEAVAKLPRWIEFVLNTPSHHRVHHANNPKYLDSNYGGTFIIWDRMFGTFVEEDEPCRYGLVHDVATHNPLRVCFHEWFSMFKDMWVVKGLKNKLLYLVGPPGWSHDGSRQTSDMIKAREIGLSSHQKEGLLQVVS